MGTLLACICDWCGSPCGDLFYPEVLSRTNMTAAVLSGRRSRPSVCRDCLEKNHMEVPKELLVRAITDILLHLQHVVRENEKLEDLLMKQAQNAALAKNPIIVEFKDGQFPGLERIGTAPK